MRHRCIHCGHISEIEAPADQRFTCTACGKSSWIPETTAVATGDAPASRRRSRLRDFAIGVLAALILCVLAYLFFRRDQPLHQLVFGELRGPAAESPISPQRSIPNFNSSSSSSSNSANNDSRGVPHQGQPTSVASGNSASGGGVVTNPATGTPTSSGSGKDDFHGIPYPGQRPSATEVAPVPNSTTTGSSGNQGPQVAANPAYANSSPAPTTRPPASETSPVSSVPRTSPQTTSPSSSSTARSETSPSARPSATPNHVANEGANELLKLAKSDDAALPDSTHSAERTPKTTGPGAVPTPEQVAALANPDANSASNSSGGKTAEDNQPKHERAFDPNGGSNVVFVLDRSLSMKGEKSNVARHELVQTLQKLGADKTFYVFFFPDKAMPAPGPLPATPENVQAMTGWINSVGHSFGSDPTKAMLKALGLRPNTIWLLSDGRFSGEVASTIRLANENIHTQINTVAFYSHDGERVLKQIAEENHGTYRFIAPPLKPSGLEPIATSAEDSSTRLTTQP